MEILTNYMDLKKVDQNIQAKTREQLTYIWKEEDMLKEDKAKNLINKLSPSLKEELLIHTIGQPMKSIPFLIKNFSEDFLRELIHILVEKKWTPTETIVQENEFDDNLQMILNGEVEMLSEHPINQNFRRVTTLKSSDFFGELGFFAQKPAIFTIKCIGFVKTLIISRENFIGLLKKQPNDYERFFQIRDKILIQNDYSDLYIRCSSCNTQHHQFYECPILHQITDNELICKKAAYSKKAKRSIFKRNEFQKTNTLRKAADLENCYNELLNRSQYSDYADNIGQKLGENGLVSQINKQGQQEICLETSEDSESKENQKLIPILVNPSMIEIKNLLNSNETNILMKIGEEIPHALEKESIQKIKPIINKFKDFSEKMEIKFDNIESNVFSKVRKNNHKEKFKTCVEQNFNKNKAESFARSWARRGSFLDNKNNNKLREKIWLTIFDKEELNKFDSVKNYETYWPNQNAEQILKEQNKFGLLPKFESQSQKYFIQMNNLPECTNMNEITMNQPESSRVSTPKGKSSSKLSKSKTKRGSVFGINKAFFAENEKKGVNTIFNLVEKLKEPGRSSAKSRENPQNDK